MLICASRRTDMPAFHSEWLMNRLRDGYCLVRNPVKRDVVHRIDLSRENVDALLFMTKDPQPMIGHLDELIDMGMNFSFQITITPYGKDIEPGVPHKRNVIKAFKEISERIGKERVIWRYDPIILNDDIDIEYHREGFEYIVNELSGHVERCTFGFIDIYKKLEEAQRPLRTVSDDEKLIIGRMLSEVSKHSGIKLNQCSGGLDMTQFGIENRACISREYLRELNIPFTGNGVPLRKGCTCVRNIDIGGYDTCAHDCIYCYANNADGVKRSKRSYDPKNEMLFGSLRPDDKIVKLSSRNVRRITDF